MTDRATPRLWDISPAVGAHSPVFPGDTPFRAEPTARIGPDVPVNLTRLTMSPHTGAHADAPLHYSSDGASAAELELAPYLGPCRVVHAVDPGPLVEWRHVADALADPPPRVLVRTYAAAPTDRWDPDLTAFHPDLLERLAGLGVRLVGIDSASADPADSKTLDAHRVLLRQDMRVLENLVLDDVPPGDYELLALPLRLVDVDAAPVRAVLRELP